MYDNSIFPEKMFNTLKSLAHLFINDTTDVDVNYWTNYAPYKGFAELKQLTEIFTYIYKYNIPIGNIFKISGRYCINNRFDIKQYNNTSIFKKNYNVYDREYYYTSFYYIANKDICDYINTIFDIFNRNKDNEILNTDLEVLLPFFLKYNFNTTNNLGITQNISVWKDTTCI